LDERKSIPTHKRNARTKLYKIKTALNYIKIALTITISNRKQTFCKTLNT